MVESTIWDAKNVPVPGTINVWYDTDQLFNVAFCNTHKVMAARSTELKQAAYRVGELIWDWAWHPINQYDGILPKCPQNEDWQKDIWLHFNMWADRAKKWWGFTDIEYAVTDAKGNQWKYEHGKQGAYPMIEDYFNRSRLDYVRLQLLDKNKNPVVTGQYSTVKRGKHASIDFYIYEDGKKIIHAINNNMRDILDPIKEAVYQCVLYKIAAGDYI